jgi:hypothetical protein
MSTITANRGFYQGESIVYYSTIRDRDKRPFDPDVVEVTALKCAGTDVLDDISNTVFTRSGTGEWFLEIQTDALDPGVYKIEITGTKGPSTEIEVDTFVIKARI